MRIGNTRNFHLPEPCPLLARGHRLPSAAIILYMAPRFAKRHRHAGACHTGRALATTAGPLVLNQITVGQGQFNAQTFAYAAGQPMSGFSASVVVHPLASGSTGASELNGFSVQGTFQLGAGAETVDPATQDVVLRLGNQEFAIPAGSFEGSKEAGYAFEGKIGGVALRAALTPQSAIDYSFQVEAAGVPPLPDRLAVRLTLGAAVGRTMVKPVRP